MTRLDMIKDIVELVKEADNAVLSSIYEHLFDKIIDEIEDFYSEIDIYVEES